MEEGKILPKKSIRFFNDREVQTVWDSIQLVSATHGSNLKFQTGNYL